jgi:CRISPR-associated protein Cmr4
LLFWEVICKNPKYFRINNEEIGVVNCIESIHDIVKEAHPYLEYLGIGGMGTRGMGRLRVLKSNLSHKQAAEYKHTDGVLQTFKSVEQGAKSL